MNLSNLIFLIKHIFTDKSSFSIRAQSEFKLSRSRITQNKISFILKTLHTNSNKIKNITTIIKH